MVNRTRFILTVLFIISLVPVLVFAGVIDLPVTGQTKCYDPNGAEISCAGTGQDGDIRAGVAWHRGLQIRMVLHQLMVTAYWTDLQA